MRVAKKYIIAAKPADRPPLARMSKGQYIGVRLFAAGANEDPEAVIVACAMETLRQIFLNSMGPDDADSRVKALVRLYVTEGRSPADMLRRTMAQHLVNG